jgi:hypothetical protein
VGPLREAFSEEPGCSALVAGADLEDRRAAGTALSFLKMHLAVRPVRAIGGQRRVAIRACWVDAGPESGLRPVKDVEPPRGEAEIGAGSTCPCGSLQHREGLMPGPSIARIAEPEDPRRCAERQAPVAHPGAGGTDPRIGREHLPEALVWDRQRLSVERRLSAFGRQIGLPLLAGDDLNAILRHAAQVRHEAAQRRRRFLSFADGGGGRSETNVFRGDPERLPHPAQQQRHLCRLRADVAVRLVQHDPAQRALRTLEDRSVLSPHQHVFEHRGVSDENRGWILPQPLAVRHHPAAGPFMGWQRLFEMSVVERVGDPTRQGRNPLAEPLALAVDQSVQRVEDDGLHAPPPPGRRLPQEVV